jgi:hypothetical protein
MFHAPRQPIESGDNQNGELPLPSILQHQVEAGATSFAAGDANVGVFASDLKAPLLCEQTKVVQLVINALFRGADSGVYRAFPIHKCLLMLSSKMSDGLMNGRSRSISGNALPLSRETAEATIVLVS